MGLKSVLSKLIARQVANNIKKWSSHPIETQNKVFKELMQGGGKTKFGADHNLGKVETYEDFKQAVPVQDYEGLKPYIEDVKQGASDVLWPGRPIYFCKTSGTTSGAKYIPLTKESMPNHIDSARNALLMYIAETGRSEFVDGKMIFLQGSPVLEEVNGINFGRLSGIVAHHVPNYLLKNRMPSYDTNCIDDWEQKVDAIVEETLSEKMTLISGIPAWVQMYFERLQNATNGKQIKDVFPDFSLFVYGGVNFEPYRQKFKQLIGKHIPSIELYPASEGFIAFQDSQKEDGMLLVLNKGIFYEFIPAEEFFDDNPTRISLAEVQVGVNYVIILNTNAGLWGYNIGDTVKFVSTSPYRVVVTGRIKHFTSAFGEHVIAEEVEQSMKSACDNFGCSVTEFTVAPQVNPMEGELPYHEWFVEFDGQPENLDQFRLYIDRQMQAKNPYYLDLLEGNVLQPLKITPIQTGGFVRFMKDRGKLGGQNKIPRLGNTREIADQLKPYHS